MWKPPEIVWSKREGLGFAALMIALFTWTLAPLEGYDFWNYLAVGRYILEGNGLGWSESFLGTTSALSFDRYGDQTWLTSLFLYPFYSFGGPLGLVFCRSLLLCVISGVTYVNCRLLGATPWSAALWSALGLWTVRSRFLLRSYLFSDLGLAVLVFCLIKFHHHPRKRLVALALTFIVWTNFHQGVIAGWILIFVWVVFGGTDKREGLKTLVVVFFAGLTRPHGYFFFSFLYDHFANTKAIQGVTEWAPLSPSAMAEHLGPMLGLALILGIWHLSTADDKKKQPWYYLAVVAAFLVLAFRSQRAVAELLPVAFPLLVPFLKQPRWTALKGGLMTAGLAALMLSTNPPSPWNRLPVLYPYYPTRLTEIARTLPPQIFNSYEYGSYLIFHEVPPFIHGTTYVYKEQLVIDFQAVLNPTPRREEILRQFDVQTVLLHPPTENDATEDLVNYLYSHPDWKMVAWDDSGILFTKGDAATGLIAVKPWEETVHWRDPVAAKNELEALIPVAPSARAHLFLCQLASEQNDWPEVAKHARAALALVPSSSQAWQSLAFASVKLQDMPTALEATKNAVRWAPDNPEVQFNRALILHRGHPNRSGLSGWLIDREIRHHLKETLKLSPGNVSAQTLLSEI